MGCAGGLVVVEGGLFADRLAIFGPEGPHGPYRYRLDRDLGHGPRWCWIMLNPSTADAFRDDPTIRRCIDFTRRGGGGSLTVVNLCAWRSTDPRGLLNAADPVGPLNALVVAGAVRGADVVVAAWGASARREWVNALPPLPQPSCLGTTRSGAPRHPLYVAATTALSAWAAPPPDTISGDA